LENQFISFPINQKESDFYFPKNDKFYLTTKINYLDDFGEERNILGGEVMIGIRFNQ